MRRPARPHSNAKWGGRKAPLRERGQTGSLRVEPKEVNAMEYKDYDISEFVNDKGQWQAHIRRQDGKHMWVEETSVPVFTTRHADSENEVIRIAKETIDTKISVARE
jgi:hypothetical protein